MASESNRVLFLMKYPLDRPYNLKGKFDGQMAAVKNLGCNVAFVSWDKGGMHPQNVDERMPLGHVHFASTKQCGHRVVFFDLIDASKKAIDVP